MGTSIVRPNATTPERNNLFSRPMPASQSPKRIRGFLGMPGELRNLVYSYYFEGQFCVELAAKGAAFQRARPKTVKLSLNLTDATANPRKHIDDKGDQGTATIRMSRQLGRYKRVDGVQTKWASSLCALILVCKQIHNETIRFLYEKTAVVCASSQRLTNFLDVVPKHSLSGITKLQIHYSTYGHLGTLSVGSYAKKHLDSWNAACKTASKTLVNLRELEVWYSANYSPFYFDLRQPWLQPLYQFRRLLRHGQRSQNQQEPCKALPSIRVHFKSKWTRYYSNSDRLYCADGCTELHALFARAIRYALLGFSEEAAMTEVRDAWERRYLQYPFHEMFRHNLL